MNYVAEYVSVSHPDRLCDFIVNAIAKKVLEKDIDAFVQLEASIFEDKFFISGRIAYSLDYKGKFDNKFEMNDYIKSLFSEAGYCNKELILPFYKDVKIFNYINLERLDEKEEVCLSNDQCIACGYAIKNAKTDYVDMAHYIVNEIGEAIESELHYKISYLNRHFKLIVRMNDNDGNYHFDNITLIIGSNKNCLEEIYFKIKDVIYNCIKVKLPNETTLLNIDSSILDITILDNIKDSGPYGDNGQTGRKLVIDYYGPDVPIGGGALYGKGVNHVDVKAAIQARLYALYLVKEYDFKKVFTRISYTSNKLLPDQVEAYSIDRFGAKLKINVKMPDNITNITNTKLYDHYIETISATKSFMKQINNYK